MLSTGRVIATALLLVFLSATPVLAKNDGKAPALHTISIQKTMSKSSEYVDKYAEAAMEQMRRYGIPASVTLAQGIIESASGQSELSRKGNNHFGIKATSSWIENGGRYLVYSDDKPNEKFCQYASVSDSFEHHSLFLKSNSRYADLFKLQSDDYIGWTKGLQDAGYATSNKYAASLQSIIKSNGLDKYDKMVLAEAPKQQVAEEKKPEQTAQAEENVSQQAEKKSDKDYFNTISASADNENSWQKFFGATDTGNSFADPIVEIASTLFAGLMALAIQIDNNGIVQVDQQNTQTANSESINANSMASKNFEEAMNSMNNNTIKRTRS